MTNNPQQIEQKTRGQAHSLALSTEPKVTSVDSRSLLVLLVEDDPQVSFTIKQMLRAIGHRFEHVSNGLEAISMMKSDPNVDLVLTDYQMPELNGVELVKKLRLNEDNRPVVILTGFGAAVNVDPEFKPNAILGKPIRLSKLQDALTEVMENSVKG